MRGHRSRVAGTFWGFVGLLSITAMSAASCSSTGAGPGSDASSPDLGREGGSGPSEAAAPDAQPDRDGRAPDPTDASSPDASDSSPPDASDSSPGDATPTDARPDGAPGPVCGDTVVDPGEECDDGNATVCDGCEACERRSWMTLPARASARVPGIAAALPRGSMCVEGWMKVGAVPEAVLASSYGTPNDGAFILRCTRNGALGALRFGNQSGGTIVDARLEGTECADGRWHHFAGCREVVGGTLTNTVFLDGQPRATSTGPIASLGANAEFVLGGVTYGADGLDGSIDEVRVSRGLRYTGAFTPARRLTVDADTVGLWHLDEGMGTTFADATAGARGGTLGATATWAPDTGYDAALCVAPGPVCGDTVVDPGEECDDGNATVCDGCEACERRSWMTLPARASARVPGIAAALPRGSMCVEGWMKVGAVPEAVLASSYGTPNDGAFILRCTRNGALGALRFGNQSGGTIVDARLEGTECADGRWHHFAGCREVVGGTLTNTVFLDGQPRATSTGPIASLGANAELVLGGATYGADGLDGSIDEVRVSRGLRYTGAFTPARRLTVDADTVGLWHLDEGMGTTFADATAGARGGTLGATATWAPDTGYDAALCR